MFNFIGRVFSDHGTLGVLRGARRSFPDFRFLAGPRQPLESCFCKKGPLGISLKRRRAVPPFQYPSEPKQKRGVAFSRDHVLKASSSGATGLRRQKQKPLYDAHVAIDTIHLHRTWKARQAHPRIHRLLKAATSLWLRLRNRVRIFQGTCCLCGGIKEGPNLSQVAPSGNEGDTNV